MRQIIFRMLVGVAALVSSNALHAGAPAIFDPVPLREQEKTLSAVIEKMPPSLNLFSRRGDLKVFLGDFKGAVSDYERMIAMDSSQDAPHWRLGIAYYFAGEFSKAARQFEKYHAHDARDRENGVWKFFSQMRGEGLEPARKGLLVYTEFDREPFPAVYRMLAGDLAPEAVLQQMRDKGQAENPQVMFFAKYYAGVFMSFTGRREEGLRLVEEAVALFPAAGADRGGPGYMWHAARLHVEELRAGIKR